MRCGKGTLDGGSPALIAGGLAAGASRPRLLWPRHAWAFLLGWMRLSVRGREGGGSRHSLEGGGCDLAYVCFVPANYLGGFTKKNKESGFLKSEIAQESGADSNLRSRALASMAQLMDYRSFWVRLQGS